MSVPAACDSGDSYAIRHLHPNDAAGVTRLVEMIYGDSYYPRTLYAPAQIVELNNQEKLVSAVALDLEGEVVGHYALERPRLGLVAEASDALVHVQHRRHHLMEQMRLLLRERAEAMGLVGLVGYPVTNHLFSQKADEHIGAWPCGVALGLWPRSFHNMPEELSQRMSFVIYFRFLHPRNSVRHVATRHSQIIGRIYQQREIQVELFESGPASGLSEIMIEEELEVQTGTIHVRRVGADSAKEIEHARRQLCLDGARAVMLELPLAQPGTADLCEAVEQMGFFFSGVGPAFADDGDVLLLQYVCEEIDVALVQIESPIAKEILAYVTSERERVREV
jgi:hypothetical protein